jgi:hypothetical protein
MATSLTVVVNIGVVVDFFSIRGSSNGGIVIRSGSTGDKEKRKAEAESEEQ